MGGLTISTAERMARLALGHVTREYPNKLDHILLSDGDALSPKVVHPIFYGSFDWHSCVHGWWSLLTVRRLFPDLQESREIEELARSSFTAKKVEAERAYLRRGLAELFERPYGWGWLLYLHLESSRHLDQQWANNLEPLASVFAENLYRHLRVLTYPVRVGVHANTAFALILAREWAERFDPRLSSQITETVWKWFANDRNCQAWEPSGEDFVSPSLTEAVIVAEACPQSFKRWFADFLPEMAHRCPSSLFVPAHVSDRRDSKIAHLDGLNLSRAFCWRRLARYLPNPEAEIALEVADKHIDCTLAHLSDHYVGEHWLQSFALLALLEGQRSLAKPKTFPREDETNPF